MKRRFGFGLEILGLAGVAFAGYVVAPALGYALAGVFAVLLGVAMGAKP